MNEMIKSCNLRETNRARYRMLYIVSECSIVLGKITVFR